jgi:hypothetical protein
MKLNTAKSGYGNEGMAEKGYLGSQHGERKHLRLNILSSLFPSISSSFRQNRKKSEKIMNCFVQYARRKK